MSLMFKTCAHRVNLSSRSWLHTLTIEVTTISRTLFEVGQTALFTFNTLIITHSEWNPVFHWESTGIIADRPALRSHLQPSCQCQWQDIRRPHSPPLVLCHAVLYMHVVIAPIAFSAHMFPLHLAAPIVDEPPLRFSARHVPRGKTPSPRRRDVFCDVWSSLLKVLSSSRSIWNDFAPYHYPERRHLLVEPQVLPRLPRLPPATILSKTSLAWMSKV
ncbi:hypothetical protein QBC45DRAFT_199618 [Copromyces sp. CBS 386.78]|nr:hypothetical protein QBC45DRAFT_199618 [Copromyces sp. CBS 386.78]